MYECYVRLVALGAESFHALTLVRVSERESFTLLTGYNGNGGML